MTTWLYILMWALLAGWVGAWGSFAFVIAPNAFRVLPTALAGELVSPVLRSLNFYAMGAGIALAAIAWKLDRGKLAVYLPLILVGSCAFSHFHVTAEIASVRPSEMLQSGGSVAASEHFSLYHQMSEALFGLVGIGALGLLALHARQDAKGHGS